MAVKYITQADGKGWIKVKRDTTGAEVSLPHYLNKIYNYLFNHRKGDGLSVGTITFNRYYD
jgi:hypothetical protein